MTRDELIYMAMRAANFSPLDDDARELVRAMIGVIEPLIRADENEVCAKIVEARKPLYTHLSGINACSECASSIRARRKA